MRDDSTPSVPDFCDPANCVLSDPGLVFECDVCPGCLRGLEDVVRHVAGPDAPSAPDLR
jgi:hypothetical protein